jgi:hypothetical protein
MMPYLPTEYFRSAPAELRTQDGDVVEFRFNV